MLFSTRLTSSPSRTVLYDGAYAPFGEPYAQSGTSDLSFTGMNQDTSTGLYDFLYREYSTQGRWSQPDPAGLAAVDLSNPQSWNRYAYVENSPTFLVDPFGLFLCGTGCTPVSSDPGGGAGGGSGGGNGGFCPLFVSLFNHGGIHPDSSCGTGGGGNGGSGGAQCFSDSNGTIHCTVSAPAPPSGGDGAPPSWLTYAANRNRCASNNSLSFASALNISKANWLGQSLLGNDVATLSQLILGPARGGAASQIALSNPTPLNAIAATVGGITGQLGVDTGRIAVAANGAGTYYAAGSIVRPLASTSAVKVLSRAFTAATGAKVLYDAALYIDALIVCSQDSSLQ